MRVAALTSGLNVPSARFRVRQHIPLLRALGLDIDEYFPRHDGRQLRPRFLAHKRGRAVAPLFAIEMLWMLCQRLPGVIASHSSDVTWLERNFVPLLDDTAFMLNKPLVVDIDDAIWLYNPFARSTVSRLIGRAAAVIAGNSFLASWCAHHARDVHVVPTAVDSQKFCPRQGGHDGERAFTVGWTGSAANFRYLQAIEPALRQFLQSTPGAKLLIVAERQPELTSVPAGSLIFRPWSPDTEHLLVQQMDVGIMPLEDSELARGKCSFKMLQYMACGVPAIVSPVGMNVEVLARGAVGVGARTQDEWVDALDTYHRDSALRKAHGDTGRRVVLQEYDTRVVAGKIDQILRSVA